MGEDIIPGEINPPAQPEAVSVPVQVRPELHLVDSVMTDPTTAHAVEVSQGLIEDTVRPVPGTAIEDEVKAWDMAQASNEARSDAAAIRQAAVHTEDLRDTTRFGDSEGVEKAKAWFAENPEHSPSKIAQARTVTEAYDINSMGSSVAKELREDSKIIDDRANKIEDWAAVLHDHPVSDEYKMKYPDIEFTASNLADMEDLNDDEIEDIKKAHEFLDNQSGMDIAMKLRLGFDDVPTIEDLLARSTGSSEHESNLRDWHELNINPDATIREIKRFYDRLYTKAFILPKRSRASVMSNLFNEIKTGQASLNSQTPDQNFQ